MIYVVRHCVCVYPFTLIYLDNISAVSFSLQEPLLVMPVQCMERLGPIPGARDLRQLDWERRRKLLALAQLLVEATVYESTQRTVDWLISLCEDRDPEPVPYLDWLEQRTNDDFDALSKLDIGSRSMTKLVPQMRFTARMLRVREG